MVGNGEVKMSDVLSETQLRVIVERALGPAWRAQSCEIRRASEGLTGFLGDHFRMKLVAKNVDSDDTTTLNLFVKCLPLANPARTRYIIEGGFFKQEHFMYQMLEELGGCEGPHRWCPKAYFCDETIVVMPDLTVEGFSPRHCLDTLELQDAMAVVASVAHFHAAFANYATKKTVDPTHPYNLLDEFAEMVQEPTFYDSPYVRASAKLSANLINIFSAKYKNTIPNLEQKLLNLFLKACSSFRDSENTLNVIIHKDLWMNNIMFGPGTVILVDYQCIRYVPPAFDLIIFLYMTTTKEFRNVHEKDVLSYYYSVFVKSLDPATEKRVKEMEYNEEEFLRWCEASRMFGMVFALALFPYVLMDSVSGRKYFDDPATYERYATEDRTEPVVQHCRDCPRYRDRQLVVLEEFIDTYLKQ